MDLSTLEGIPHDAVTIVEIPALAISSTDCRNRTAQGEPVWYLVPTAWCSTSASTPSTPPTSPNQR